MGCCSSRVLVVEDYEPFRRFLSSAPQEAPGLQIIGEVSDGLRSRPASGTIAAEPVLVDIGLPTLNGIEAARRIYKLVPECKILFLSKNPPLMWCKKPSTRQHWATWLRHMPEANC